MLTDPVNVLKGVGEKVEEDLALMGIRSVNDLLHYFPHRYNIFEIKPLAELIHDDQITIVGKVIYDSTVNYYGGRKSRLSFTLEVEGVAVKAVMFNRAFAKNQIKQGINITLSGKWDAHRLQVTVGHYDIGFPKQEEELKPIYPLKGSVTNYRLQMIIKQCIEKYAQYIEEIIPNQYLLDYKLPTRRQAIIAMHFPEDNQTLKHARRRFTYEELLIFQIKMKLLRKIHRESERGATQNYDEVQVREFVSQLPYTLTNSQEKSLNEILTNMKSPYRMNRLLQGDVGSGKTMVATISLLASLSANNQGAFMVPTEILAEQHYQSLNTSFNDEVNIALLTSSVKGKARKEILTGIENNDIQIVIGTHSLIQDDVIFNKLGLVVIDEQHRFGVKQRRALRDKGLEPDVLFMTATPIPRTLAITAFGDMDISIIDELPSGRKEIETFWIKDNLFERVLNFIKKRVTHGEQAYIVSPLIEESEAFDYQNVVDLFHQLESFYPPTIKIGLLHGRLLADEKEAIMKQFINNEINILVSTTVIEVGVNVPNATIMVIYDAERFGLSQLHQLRGRVGRGEQQSYCILIADPKGETGKERMRIMTETNDGFRLSEEDLKLRGPGDFFGRKQSGLPDFKVADIIHDNKALEIARQDAEEIVEKNLLDVDPLYLPLKLHLEGLGFFENRLD